MPILLTLYLDHEFASSLHHPDYREHCSSNSTGNTTVDPQACPLQFWTIVLQDGTTTGSLGTCQVSESSLEGNKVQTTSLQRNCMQFDGIDIFD